MFVNCLKDVSALLVMIRSVRECNTQVHLEAERALLPQLIAFGHPNYSRYMTYQHALLEVHRISNTGKILRKMVLEVAFQETNFLQNMEIFLYQRQ